MALCTQNRCADQTALHLVSPPRSIQIHPIDEDSNRTRPSFPFGHRDARTNPNNKPLFLFQKICLQQDKIGGRQKAVQCRSAHIFWLTLSLEFQNPACSRLRLDPSPAQKWIRTTDTRISVLCSKPCVGWGKSSIAKDSIQPQVPLRLPCYDFTPVEDPTVVCANKPTKSLCGTSVTQKSWVIIGPMLRAKPIPRV